MSSKSAPEPRGAGRRPWSLAARLTAWSAISSFALVVFVAVGLEEALESGLDQEDDGLLADEVDLVASLARHGDFDGLRREIESTTLLREREKLSARLLDEDGRIEMETPGLAAQLPVEGFPRVDPDRIRFADSSGRDGTPFRVCVARIVLRDQSHRVLQVAHDTSEDLRTLAAFRRRLLLVLAVAFVACALIGYAVARGGIRPVEAIAEAARRVRPSNLEERIATGGLPAELAGLAHSLNGMLDRLEESLARLSRFSADLAHEIRTPVGRLRGEAEVALGRARTPEEYREVLSSCVDECARLADLIDRLLFLARTEDPRAQVEKVPVDLATEMSSVQEFWGPGAEEAGVRLELELPGVVKVPADPALLRRAVGNLVANAIAHTPRGGTVTLSVQPAAEVVRVEVRDTGTGIPEEHLPHVLDRFYRVDGARSSGPGGAGLGLAIVQGIAALHGGSVEIESRVGWGTRVGILFPR